MGSENIHGRLRNAKNGFGFDLFRAIPQIWRWISQSHCMSNRWWNLGFICECWNRRAVKAVDAHTFTKQTLYACQKSDGNCFLGQNMKGVLMAEFMQQEITVTSEVYCETLKTYVTSVVLLSDNACPHTVARTWALLKQFNWELFDHTPCSSDLLRMTITCLPTRITVWDHSASTILRSWRKVWKRGWAHSRQTFLT
jgi:hypothetical protein